MRLTGVGLAVDKGAPAPASRRSLTWTYHASTSTDTEAHRRWHPAREGPGQAWARLPLPHQSQPCGPGVGRSHPLWASLAPS